MSEGGEPSSQGQCSPCFPMSTRKTIHTQSGEKSARMPNATKQARLTKRVSPLCATESFLTKHGFAKTTYDEVGGAFLGKMCKR